MYDGCTAWFDGEWRHCCDAHDQAYIDGTVTLMSHWELAQCVSQTSGGILLGLLMFVATTVWWMLKRL